MSFESIRGQGAAVEYLKSSLANNNVSHAYMFTGPGGVGKRLTAINFAKALNCLEPVSFSPCGACSQCKKIDASNHPDVRVICPDKEESGFGVDKIRAITKDIGLRPYEGRRKAYILDRADLMNHVAQNALLKTLEEPPSDSVLVLLAEDIGAVFSTIQSRVKRLRFFPLPAADVEQIITEKCGVDRPSARILALMSAGSPGKALKYGSEGFLERRAGFIRSFKSGNFPEAETESLPKQELKMLLEIMLAWYRDILVAKSGALASALINSDLSDAVYHEAGRLSLGTVNNIINRVILTGSFLERNLNPKLAMSALGMELLDR